MKINRREFLILTAVFTAGCGSMGGLDAPANSGPRTVNAGAARRYAADGVYEGFRNRGFFIIRRDEKLFAISAICTHRKCELDARADRSFHCPCHGSTFDTDGHVTHGPARKDLPVFTTSVNADGELLVTLGG